MKFIFDFVFVLSLLTYRICGIGTERTIELSEAISRAKRVTGALPSPQRGPNLLTHKSSGGPYHT